MTERQLEQGANEPTRMLRLPEVMARTGLSRSTIYERVARRRFPRPVSLGERAIGWIEAEIDAWIRERAGERRSGDDPAADTHGTPKEESA